MTSLTINIENSLKSKARMKAKKDGVTLTFIVTQALKAYNQGKLEFSINQTDEEITASFNVSSPKGKSDCLESFKQLV